MDIIARTEAQAQAPLNGVYESGLEDDPCVIYVAGELITFAGTEAAASRIYADALEARHAHFDRCPEDFIPFDGAPMVAEPVRACDEYGLQEPRI